jgi:hypothetical protein
VFIFERAALVIQVLKQFGDQGFSACDNNIEAEP